jgi:hypothetical protein
VGTARDWTEATAIGPDERARRPVRADGAAPPELARAVRLLAEGSSALDDARRLR